MDTTPKAASLGHRTTRGFAPGFSTAAALLTLAAMLASGMFIMQKLINDKNASLATAQNAEKILIKQALTAKVDCPTTMQKASCPKGGPVAIWEKDNSGASVLLVSNSGTGTKFGRFYTVLAECGTSGVTIKIANLAANGDITSTNAADFNPNPLTKERITWSDPRSVLIQGNPGLCGNAAATTTSNPTITPTGGTFANITDFNNKLRIVAGTLYPTTVGCGTGGRHYTGNASCPKDYYPISYSVDCSLSGRTSGGLLSQSVDPSINGWGVDCCSMPTGGSAPGAFFVACAQLP